MQQCSNGDVRKKLHMAFMNRAYPENEGVLLQVIEKNAKLAELLGYKNFASLDVANVMAKSPEKIDAFLEPIAGRARLKAKSEFEELTRELPEGVSLSPESKNLPVGPRLREATATSKSTMRSTMRRSPSISPLRRQ